MLKVVQNFIRIVRGEIALGSVDDQEAAVLRNRILRQKVQALIIAVQLRQNAGKIAAEALLAVSGEHIDLRQALTRNIRNRRIDLSLGVVPGHLLLIGGVINGILIQIRIIHHLIPAAALHDQRVPGARHDVAVLLQECGIRCRINVGHRQVIGQLLHFAQRPVHHRIHIRAAGQNINRDVLVHRLQVGLRVVRQRIQSARCHIELYSRRGELIHCQVRHQRDRQNERNQAARVRAEAQCLLRNGVSPLLNDLCRQEQKQEHHRCQIHDRGQIDTAVQKCVKPGRNVQRAQDLRQHIPVLRNHVLQIRHHHGQEQAGKREYRRDDDAFCEARKKDAHRHLCQSEEPHAKESCVALCIGHRAETRQQNRIQAQPQNNDGMHRRQRKVFAQNHLTDAHRRRQNHLIRSGFALLRKAAHAQNRQHDQHQNGGHRQNVGNVRLQSDQTAHSDVQRHKGPHDGQEQPSREAVKQRRKVFFEYCFHSSSYASGISFKPVPL